VVGPRDLDHPLGEIHAGDEGAFVTELPRQVAGAAAGVEHGEPADVAGELPQDGVGVHPAVAVSVGPDLESPVIRKTVPAPAGFLERAVAHRRSSPLSVFNQPRITTLEPSPRSGSLSEGASRG